MLFKFAVKDFIDDRRLKNLSPYTITGYEQTLGEFHGFCISRSIVDSSDVTHELVKQYFLHCQSKRGNNAVTLNHKLINLRAFFNYAEAELELYSEKTNPIRKISRFKTDVKIDVFTDHHIRQMLSYYRRLKQREKTFYAFRDSTIIVVLLGTGMRVGELANLRWRDIDFDHDTITVFGKKRIMGTIPMTKRLRQELIEYRIFVEQHLHNLPESFIVDNHGNSISANAIKCIFKRLKTVMNFSDVRLSSHTFRHTFAHRCLMSGMDVFTLQRLLRHSELSMTQRYLAIWGSALKEQNDKFNPLNSINL